MIDQAHMAAPRSSVRRIAFRTGRGLGDAVLCEPLVRAVKSMYPKAEVTVLLPESCRGIDRLGFTGDRFQPWVEGHAFVRLADGFHLAIDADPAEYAKDFETAMPSGGVFVRLFAHYRAEAEHTTAYERMAEGLRRIGIDAMGDVPRLSLSATAEEEAVDALRDLRWGDDTPVFVFHPGSSSGYAFKRWAPEGFAFVADELASRYDAAIVIVGGSDEAGLVDYIVGRMAHGGRVRRFLGRPLVEVAALLKRCTVFTGNDSGVGHLAAALGRPAVTVAGPTSAHFWAPMTDRALVVDRAGCCYDPAVCGVHCLRAVRGCEVLGAVEALLTATTRRERFPCLDPVRVVSDLSVTSLDDDGAVLCSRLWNMPMTVERGMSYVRNVLAAVEQFGSVRQVLQEHPDAEPLIAQCLRHAIILPIPTTKEHINDAE